jgi:hypothetical protein
MKAVITASLVLLAAGCGSLEKKAALIDVGASKADVTTAMGAPDDRQAQGNLEAWQYCKTGAGLGYHDYRVIWFRDGRVSGFNSYKSSRPASSCKSDIRPVRWEEAPDVTVEIRDR